jgi:putative ABC transport system substrate-binding protein
MKRREFITLLGGAAATSIAWPRMAGAQQREMPVIGFLNSRGPDDAPNLTAAFHQGLKETGYVEGQSIVIEYRWANNQHERLPELAAELVRHQVALIGSFGGNVSAVAAKAATTILPIVFTVGGDPIELGLVTSLNRPGGNLTGVSLLLGLLGAKRLELLRELVPTATVIAVLINPSNPGAKTYVQDAQEAARALGQQIQILSAGSEDGITTAFAALAQLRAGAVLVATDAFFIGRREQLVALAARYAVPAIYEYRDFAAAGGLVSYGPSIADAYRQAGIYAGRILKGAKPADLPIVQPTKFELVINLKTANALGLDVPPTLLARADEVIE